jgi:hypothetical protein
MLLIPVLAFLATAGLIAYFGGNSGSSPSTGGTPVLTEAQDVIRTMTDRYNAKDMQGYLDFYTDKGLDSRYHLTREEATTILADFIGTPPVTIFRFGNSKVTDNTTEVHVLTFSGKVASEDVFSLVQDAGVWKVDRYGRFAAASPKGRPMISVSMKEFGFDFDTSLIKDGNVSFKIKDDGQQRHEVILDKIPQDMNLEEAIKGGKPPVGAEPISFLGIAKPGETKRMVFDAPLDPGRYAFLCFMPDADDPAHTPHALKGMHAEFTIK